MFSPRRSSSASSPTICEVHGALQTAPAYADLIGGTLPVVGDATVGFGFEAPSPPPMAAGAGAGASISGAGARSKKRRRLTGGDGTIAVAASKLWQAVGLPPPLAHLSDEDATSYESSCARLAAFAWQPHGLLHPLEAASRGGGASASASAVHLFCACALAPEDVVALYDLYEQRWATHRLAHPQQKRVASVAWQPQTASVLAVGCAKGVCLWRLAFAGSTGALTGGHLLRTIEIFGGPAAFPLALPTLRWHPLGLWLACASPHHGAVAICEPSARSPVATLPMHGSGGALGLTAAAVAGLAGSSVHAAGVGLVEVSPCGGAMVVGGSSGGLRVYETMAWQWNSWPRFGHHAPAVCAAWHGSAPLSDEVKMLVVALRGEASVHVLRVGRRQHGGGGNGGLLGGGGAFTAEYTGHIDLAHLCPLLAAAPRSGFADAPAADDAPTTTKPTVARRGAIVDLAWEPRGQRLIVGWAPREHQLHATARGVASGTASAPSCESGGVTVLSTSALPTLQAHLVGNLIVPCRRPPVAGSASLLRGLAFASAAPNAGGDRREGGGARGDDGATSGTGTAGVVLSVAWQDGMVRLVPLIF